MNIGDAENKIMAEVVTRLKKEPDCEECQDTGIAEGEPCRGCCDHSDRDAHCCLICGAERDYGAEIDAAEYMFGDR